MKPPKPVRRTAVALGYQPGSMDAPKVMAKGKGLVAEEIIEKAREHDIPVQEDPSLVEVLSQLELNERIPEELYQAVAEVFSFIYQLDKQAGKRN
ncbi:EscU/YscU/HrcU family type III secretion system export apparatus switch protein [Mesobacillus subterraneus]|uniref:EscU/YscU/HrcU family type III secretion system export apparatus switch protein n=1 Tax=Mesobacillus subterraneus TaxID=285983 RepID=A0A427TUH3_9BACI|nr:EscU/YscU/HrcU family type III secretion system export apparatus switch protein [Mesobacillus subterraneus]RSD28039.1 EscU/YscU/HrcU family type III secretion system export apparatus switch protein [Mesobacillus subterraneus]